MRYAVAEGERPPILPAIGAVRARRGGRAGIVWLGIASLAFLLVHLPFLNAAFSDNCVNPADSDRACYPAWWIVSLGLFPTLLLLTAVLAFREAGGVWRVPRPRR